MLFVKEDVFPVQFSRSFILELFSVGQADQV